MDRTIIEEPPAPNAGRKPFRIGCLIGGLAGACILLAALAWFAWQAFSRDGNPLGFLGLGATATATAAPPTATASASPVPPTETPVLPTATETPSPTATYTASPSPTASASPTETAAPTEAGLIVTAKSQAFCRYGPNPVFLPNIDIFLGDAMLVEGKYQYGGWLYVLPAKADRHCWIAASLVEPAPDMSVLPVVDYLALIPITSDIAPPENVTAVRNGDTVTISWDPILVDPNGFRGYLIDGFFCQDGLYLKVITSTNNTSIAITDQQGVCVAESSADLYGGTAIGYTFPVTIDWP